LYAPHFFKKHFFGPAGGRWRAYDSISKSPREEIIGSKVGEAALENWEILSVDRGFFCLLPQAADKSSGLASFL